ncbi:MAG TPA: PEGA domain-containing protein [Candidatus Acidoferrales bacterium]|nr:PEGA domain-containing protein [Candidatus Acidoferrales bacterium]
MWILSLWRFRVLLALLALALSWPPPSTAETLKVTSFPAGASVEIDGVLVGTTPYKINYPGGYFHKPHTVFAARLGHPLVVRIYKEGYATQETTITDGPFEWVDLKGHNRGRYWLLKADEVQATLKPVSKASSAEAGAGPLPAAKQNSGNELAPDKASGGRAFSAATAGPDTGVLVLSSDTAGAEIYIDGKFVGGMPSTISLAGGTHQIAVKANGKKDWEREIEVMKGSQVTLHPVLEPLP